MKTWKMTVIATLATLMVLGCVCEEDGTPMSSYSAAELDTMCVDYLADRDAVVETITSEQGCSFRAALGTSGDSEDQSDCETAYQECLVEEEEDRDDDEAWCDANYSRGRFYGCQATVAELESCLLSSVIEMARAMKKITCESTEDDVDSALGDWLLPSRACLDLYEQCPNWLFWQNKASGILPVR